MFFLNSQRSPYYLNYKLNHTIWLVISFAKQIKFTTKFNQNLLLLKSCLRTPPKCCKVRLRQYDVYAEKIVTLIESSCCSPYENSYCLKWSIESETIDMLTICHTTAPDEVSFDLITRQEVITTSAY